MSEKELDYCVVVNTRLTTEQRERFEAGLKGQSMAEGLREAIELKEVIDSVFEANEQRVKAFALERGLHAKFEKLQTLKALLEQFFGSTTTIKF